MRSRSRTIARDGAARGDTGAEDTGAEDGDATGLSGMVRVVNIMGT
jgi:hypothetical protein